MEVYNDVTKVTGTVGGSLGTPISDVVGVGKGVVVDIVRVLSWMMQMTLLDTLLEIYHYNLCTREMPSTICFSS